MPSRHIIIIVTILLLWLRVEQFSLTKSKYEFNNKFLGIKIDIQFSFENHIKCLCKKTSQKLNALLQVVQSLSFPQRKFFWNAFITF